MDYSEIGSYSICFETENETYFLFPVISKNHEKFESHLEALTFKKIYRIGNFEILIDQHLRNLIHDKTFTIEDYFEKLRKEKNDAEL